MPAIKKVKLSDAVVEEVLKALENGRFKPGQKIPSESVLTREFGVSRTTLREAFQKLEMLGKMSIRQGDGTYVSESLQPNVLSHINTAFVFGDTDMTKFLEARECLETYAIQLAAQRATDEDIAKLREIMVKQKENLDNPAAFAEFDFMFHQRLIDMSDNPILASFWTTLMSLIREEQSRIVALPGVIGQAWESHKRIIKTLEQKDPKKAQINMQQHLSLLPGIVLSDVSYRRDSESKT